jgi:transcription antitermination factor NusG
VFLPLVQVHRRDRVTPTIRHTVEVPLFSRYVFVWFTGLWSPIHHSPGVSHLIVREPGKPAIVPEAAVSALQAVEGLAAPPTPWEPGTPCSLNLGPLAGHPAVVLATHRDTATIGVMLFGALRTVSAPIAWLVERQ